MVVLQWSKDSLVFTSHKFNSNHQAHYLVTSSYKVNKGDTVLIQAAAGGLGQLVAQMCKNLGASIIIGTTSSEEKAKIAKEAGCTHVINYTSQDFVAETKKITQGKGVHVVYDSVNTNRIYEILIFRLEKTLSKRV